jgi:membrane associated rhomboid family serine protease
MLFPFRTDCPLRNTPYANYALIAINVVIYCLQALAERHVIGIDFTAYQLPPEAPKLYQFVTYAFLHGGWGHLASNMVFLYIFGNNVSDKLGQWAYVAFYLAGGIFAGIGYVLTSSPNAFGIYAPVVGASGAIAAVTGAYMVLFPRSNITVVYFFLIIGTAEIPGLLFVAAFFLLDVFYNFAGNSGVAHNAHIAGSLFGITICLTLLAARVIDRDQWDLLAYVSRWNRRRQFRQAVATGWNPYAPVPIAGMKPAPVDPRAQQVMQLRAQASEALTHRNLPAAADYYLKLRDVDPAQVLSRNAQLDIGNHFAEAGDFRHAAEAYDVFLTAYPTAEQHAHIELLTGVLYARYLSDPAKAIARLEGALPRLSAPRDVELAKAELERLKAAVPGA